VHVCRQSISIFITLFIFIFNNNIISNSYPHNSAYSVVGVLVTNSRGKFLTLGQAQRQPQFLWKGNFFGVGAINPSFPLTHPNPRPTSNFGPSGLRSPTPKDMGFVSNQNCCAVFHFTEKVEKHCVRPKDLPFMLWTCCRLVTGSWCNGFWL